MRVTHIYHSGFAVELGGCNLLFDWYRGSLPALERETPLVVFVSHEHSDHYDRRIWRLRREFSQVRYVVDEDVAAMAPRGVDVVSVEPHRDYEVALPDGEVLTVRTLESNDEGVAFLLRAEGRVVYFSGDLNSWQWDRARELNEASDEFFRTELARAVASAPFAQVAVDAAFVPVDPRLVDPAAGLVAYLDVVGAKAVFPMHYWDRKAEARAAVADTGLLRWDDVTEL